MRLPSSWRNATLRWKRQVRQLVAVVNPLTRRYLRDAFRAVASVQKPLTAQLV
jgi:hypothetical protein